MPCFARRELLEATTMKWPMVACQVSTSSSTFTPISRYPGRGCGDSRMWEMYSEYSDIAAADEPLGRIKARLAALSAHAEAQGLTGHAAFDGLRRLSIDLNGELMDTRKFSFFYRFVFFMCREQGQKSISVNTAVDAWRLALTGRFRLLDQWCQFVLLHQRHSISEDTWRQVLEFSRSVHEDLSNYDPEGAWPVLVDEFVDKMYSSESTVLGDANEASNKVSSDDHRAASAPASKATTLPGMVASAGSKRRRRDPKDDAAQVASVNSIAQLLAEMPSPISCKRIRPNGCLVDFQDPMDEGFEMSRIWEPRDLLDSADDEMLAGSMHGSPVGINQIGSCEVLSSPISCTTFPHTHWSKFAHRGPDPCPNFGANTGQGSPDPILVCPPQTHLFESFH